MYFILKLNTCIFISQAGNEHYTNRALGISETDRNPPFAGEMQCKYDFKMKGKKENCITLDIKQIYETIYKTKQQIDKKKQKTFKVTFYFTQVDLCIQTKKKRITIT